tara:strand:- start:169 stop:303 length:135 start_codon:yes stop_codon:yes gene_type:complete
MLRRNFLKIMIAVGFFANLVIFKKNKKYLTVNNWLVKKNDVNDI